MRFCAPSFRGRERSERSPEPITKGSAVATWRVHHPSGVMDSGLTGKSAKPTCQRPGMTSRVTCDAAGLLQRARWRNPAPAAKRWVTPYTSAASSRLVRLTHPTQHDHVPALKFPFNRIKISLCVSNIAELLLRGGRP